MTSNELRPVAGGSAALFSTRDPNKLTENEDAAAIIPVDDRRAILAVADGVGGLPAGEAASELVLRVLCDTVLPTQPGPEDESLRSTILTGLERANEAIGELNLGAGTTVVVVEIVGAMLRPYHIGDSMILLVGQRGKVRHVTLPHSPVGYAVHAGVIDAEEAMHHEDRHLVSNLLGQPDMWIDVGSPVEMKPRDTLLLASDGLFDNLHLNEIIDHVRTGPISQAADRLARAAQQRMTSPKPGEPSKPDDLTFLMYRRT